VVLQDSNFESWLDRFFAVYDSKSASKKFNSKQYHVYDRLKVEDLAIQSPTIWVKDMLTQLFLLHSEQQFKETLSRDAEEFREFLDMTFERLNTILQKSSEKRRKKSDFNKRLQQRIAEQKDTTEAIALQTLLESESEQAFSQDMKDSMQQRIIENEESRQTDYSAGMEMKKTLPKREKKEAKEDEGILKKIFGGIFGS
jgi:hypothetical protein